METLAHTSRTKRSSSSSNRMKCIKSISLSMATWMQLTIAVFVALTNYSLLQLVDSAALVEDELPQIFEGVIVYVNGYTDPPIHGNVALELVYFTSLFRLMYSTKNTYG